MRKLLLPILVLAFSACNQSQLIRPIMPSTPHGLVEINFSEIGNSQPNSSAKNIPSRNQTRTLSDNTGGIDMKLVSTNAFTFNPGVNRQDGFRYLSATYKIRNADSTGTLYATPRNNLSFVAVSTPSTLGGSAVSSLLRFDGTPADSSIAPLIRPTHEMTLDGNTLTPKTLTGKEDFQAYLETEIAQFQPGGLNPVTGVNSVFGYGFVTRPIGNTDSRILPAVPVRPDGYDGMVTFAVRVPLQANPNGASKDPFSFSMLFEVMDDSQTTVTESLEEQNNLGNAFSRSVGLNNAPIKILPGSSISGTPVCRIRTAGTVNNPLAFMVNSSTLNGTPALANHMFATAGSPIEAMFDQPMNAANAQTFSVNGSMTGFKTGSYTGAGTNKLKFTPTDTSSTKFPANEELEVTLNGGLNDTTGKAICAPYSFKYRTGVNVSSSASFPLSRTFNTGGGPVSVITADMNEDGKIDLIVQDSIGQLNVKWGNGFGDFSSGAFIPPGDFNFPGQSIVASDLNHDHHLDLVVTSPASNYISVMLGNGLGGFTRTDIVLSAIDELRPSLIKITDFNSDGILDIVSVNTTNIPGLNSISVLLGNGDGSFKPSIVNRISSAGLFSSISVDDLNNDGKIDVILGNFSSSSVKLLLGAGNGRFQAPTLVALPGIPAYVTTSDVNNDGKLDLIAVFFSQGAGSVGILLGNGDGSFQAPNFKPFGVNPQGVLTADLNGDGKLDIATCDSNSSQVIILLGNGDGTFQNGYAIPVGAGPDSLSAADLNNDGKLDLAVTIYPQNYVQVLFQ